MHYRYCIVTVNRWTYGFADGREYTDPTGLPGIAGAGGALVLMRVQSEPAEVLLDNNSRIKDQPTQPNLSQNGTTDDENL